MTHRRAVLTGLLATGLAPRAGWAQAGSPAYLAAARDRDGAYLLCGLSAAGQILFRLPLPDRGHAAAAHPQLAEAVAFARRPGRFAVVIDCRTGAETARLHAPEGRHFYGHGAFSGDGAQLYTTENAYDSGQGVIGIWDARQGYRRMGEVRSGGVGPHDIRLMPDGATLVVANGGIETHPETGRAKLNLPVMRPNLTYLDLAGRVQERVELAPELHKNSIRHLAVAPDGRVGVAMQWQGDLTAHPPLLALHRRGGPLRLCPAPDGARAVMQGYAGSIALSRDGRQVAITGPRGGEAQVFETETGALTRRLAEADICGVAPLGKGFCFTTGTGRVLAQGAAAVQHPLQWDNHLVPVG